MQARILFLTDLHKRDTDFTTITGYTKAIDTVQEDILQLIEKHCITHLVIGGDWYDKGYRSINRVFNDNIYDQLFHDAVDGNVYLCRGNHLFMERDSNPEMYLIQPCESMPLVHPIKTKETPLFKSPDVLQIGPLQISLFHFDKMDKHYIAARNPETKYHIAVFHDDCVLPTSVRQLSDMGVTTTDALAHYYSNIDLAICNHIHSAVGTVRVNIGLREVPAMIPGSLCITRNKQSELHAGVNLPVVTVEDGGDVVVQTVYVSLHTEMLRLYHKNETSKDTGVRGKGQQLTGVEQLTEVRTAKNVKEVLIRKGYSTKALELVDRAALTGVTANEALLLICKEDI